MPSNPPHPNPAILAENSSKTRQASKAETRRLLMAAGRELFAEKGFTETYAGEIAQRAGVAVGTIYLHFGDKEGLLREILLEAANEIYARVQQVYLDPPADMQALARAHIEAILQYVEENHRLAGFVIEMILSRHPAAVPMIDRAVGQVEEGIRLGAQYGVYRQDIDPRLAAHAEVYMNLGLLAWWAEDPTRASREAVIETLTKFRLSGIHAR
jgi:AcrR family transcriptional regulator